MPTTRAHRIENGNRSRCRARPSAAHPVSRRPRRLAGQHRLVLRRSEPPHREAGAISRRVERTGRQSRRHAEPQGAAGATVSACERRRRAAISRARSRCRCGSRGAPGESTSRRGRKPERQRREAASPPPAPTGRSRCTCRDQLAPSGHEPSAAQVFIGHASDRRGGRVTITPSGEPCSCSHFTAVFGRPCTGHCRPRRRSGSGSR